MKAADVYAALDRYLDTMRRLGKTPPSVTVSRKQYDAVLLQRAKNLRGELAARGVDEQTIRKRVQADQWSVYRGYQVRVQ